MEKPHKKEIRKFGVVALLFFGCLSGIGFWTSKTTPTIVFGFLAILGVGFLLAPARMHPVYLLWLRVSHFLGLVTTAVFLALAFYLVITPFALVKRLFGGTPISQRPDRDAASYWVTRVEPFQPKERFPKRF